MFDKASADINAKLVYFNYFSNSVSFYTNSFFRGFKRNTFVNLSFLKYFLYNVTKREEILDKNIGAWPLGAMHI